MVHQKSPSAVGGTWGSGVGVGVRVATLRTFEQSFRVGVRVATWILGRKCSRQMKQRFSWPQSRRLAGLSGAVGGVTARGQVTQVLVSHSETLASTLVTRRQGRGEQSGTILRSDVNSLVAC